MGRGLEKRKQLFDKFSTQLLLLKKHGLINREFKYERPYICPICLIEFSEDHLDNKKHKNYLTAEDAPPNALNGSKIALTCAECNNGCGQEIDCHLIDALRSIDDSFFYKGSKQTATIEFEGKRLTVELNSLGDGTLTAYHRTKFNNPTLLEKFVYGIKNKTVGPILNFRPPSRKFDPKRVNYALLKTNYIITFARFGYIFLLAPQYDSLRDQIRKPSEVIYPWTPFINDQFSKDSIGTYYILEKEIKSIMNVFSLKTDYSETIIAGFLQPPVIDMATFADLMNDKRNADDEVAFESSNYDHSADLFSDIDEIWKIKNWFNPD